MVAKGYKQNRQLSLNVAIPRLVQLKVKTVLKQKLHFTR